MTEITDRVFGNTKDQQQIRLYTLKNGPAQVDISNYGASIVAVRVPDKNGFIVDVVWGFDNVSGYEQPRHGVYGTTTGRNAQGDWNSTVPMNDEIHGVSGDLHQRVWDISQSQDSHGACLICLLRHDDRDEKIYSDLNIFVRYSLTSTHTLIVEYFARSNKDMVVNLTNYTHFNLNGHASGSILQHKFQIYADFYFPIDCNSCPTGEILSVNGTIYDFRCLEELSKIDFFSDEGHTKGDHYWVLCNKLRKIHQVAYIEGDQSGIWMKLHTNKPALQFYDGHTMGEAIEGKSGAIYEKKSGFFLAPQSCPSALDFSYLQSPVLPAQEIYHHTMVYEFGIK